MANAKIMVVANQKGGVAKTSTVRNLSYALAELGQRVLVVDFDPQFNLTTCFGIEEPDELKHTIATLIATMLNESELPPKSEYIKQIGKVDLIPSNEYLSVVDANLRLEPGSERMLSDFLETLRSDYDYMIVDTCPSLGTLTVNALTAADEVLIPVDPQFFAAMGLQQLTKTILKVKRRLNPAISFGGIIFTLCNKRTNLYKEVSQEITDAYKNGMRIFDSRIPMATKVGEANRNCVSIFEYDESCPAASAYLEFAKEVLADA